ncbi:MAG: PD-(D/E)XK nuclease family transposase [Lachnospiraceae bacterium]|nr:PD-(D/E)XK nuclease family transposase [Candidatus Merdinaster equi]
MDRAKGSLSLYSAAQLTHNMLGLDSESKYILKQKPVIAIILQAVVDEFKELNKNEIIQSLEFVEINEDVEVSNSRTNSDVIIGTDTEFYELGEMLSKFDKLFTVKNPKLSTRDIVVNLHIDIEPQKDYRPGYPIEKRGIYYLARELSSQIPIVSIKTDYNILEKCYSIWICRDNIPNDEAYTISKYKFTNIECKLSQESNYDLMELVIIRLGNSEWTGEEGLFDFLNLIFYPHSRDFEERFGKYIDLSQYEELKEEAKKMSGLGECVYNDGIAKGESYAFEVIKYINDYPEKSDEDVSAELHCNPSLVEEARKTIDNLKKSLQV